MNKRLYKSSSDAKWLGVCGGIGKYLDTDPTFVRAIYAFLTIITGVIPGLLAYLVLAWIIPAGKQTK